MQTTADADARKSASHSPLPPEFEQLRDQIEHWRTTRSRRTRMPEELWCAAMALAREHGIWRVAQALRLRYDTLSTRIRGLPGNDATPTPSPRVGPAPAAFVELAAPHEPDASPTIGLSAARRSSPSAPAPTLSTSIELSSTDGARLVVRLGSDSPLDVESLIASLWRLAR